MNAAVSASEGAYNKVNQANCYLNDREKNPDMKSGYYFKEGGEGTHIILIVGVSKRISNGKFVDGIVSYIDPLAKTRKDASNRKYVDYDVLLKSMNRSEYYYAHSIGLVPVPKHYNDFYFETHAFKPLKNDATYTIGDVVYVDAKTNLANSVIT